jgi:SAM-dependent methyltransferase
MVGVVRRPWNHSIQYHRLLLRELPSKCRRALDVGCGDGGFARELATRVPSVDALDRSERMIEIARGSNGAPNVRFLIGDLFEIDLPKAGYDFVASLSTIHHMDFGAAIERMRSLLRPEGVLAILGLARDRSPADFLVSAAAVPTNRAVRLWRGFYDPGFDIRDPAMTYGEVRRAANALLPGAAFRRLLSFRYLLVWRMP